MKVFDFTDYKEFVLQELKSQPKGGHGQFQKISKALGIHSTMVTHILRGQLHLSPEQTLGLAEYLGLGELETDYFVTLVQLARAGDQRTKRHFEKKVFALKNQAMNVGTRISAKNYLEEKDQAIFYSSWIYAAIRLLSAIPDFQTRSALAEELDLPPAKISQALEFLISRGLCVEKGGRILYAEKRTYVGQDSPFVIRHHANWRQRAIGHLDRLTSEDLAYTNPVVIGGKDFLRIREEAVQFVERFKKIAEPSPSEELCCLTLDWFRVKGGVG